MHNNATGHGNGKLWSLNAEKIEKKPQHIYSILRTDKVNHLPLESKNENNMSAFYLPPKLRKTCTLCSLPVSEYFFHFW